MKRTSGLTRVLSAAAMTGLVAGAGAAIVGCHNKDNDSAGMRSSDSSTMDHSCKGMNSCKGKGGCSSSDNGCKGKNSCKGKGGCSGKM